MQAGTRKTEEIELHGKPLCRKYLTLQVHAVCTPVSEGRALVDQTVHWALGLLAGGQRELIGAWLEPQSGPLAWKNVFEDLRVRGVEEVQFLVSKESGALCADRQTEPGCSTVLPSIERQRQGLAQQQLKRRKFGSDSPCAVCNVGSTNATSAEVPHSAASDWYVPDPFVGNRRRDAANEWMPLSELGHRIRCLIRSGDQTAQRVAEMLRRAVARKGCFPSSMAAVTFVSDVLDRIDRGFASGGSVAGRGVRSRDGRERQSFTPARHH